MKKIELEIVAMSHAVSRNNSYAVVLGEKRGARRLPIVIGSAEASAIAVALDNMPPSRPLTHDLMKSILETFDVDLREVIISNLLEGVFYAKLICERDGEEIEIDSRTSDALALAVRFQCPIYSYEFILDSAGIVLEDSQNAPAEEEESEMEDIFAASAGNPVSEDLSGYTINELDNLLVEALEAENYERAAKIRDEIQHRHNEP